jgi:hypothetical protein
VEWIYILARIAGLIPGTEWIKDREAMNFCEDFAIKLPSSNNDDSRNKGKDNFKSLFKDEGS